VQVALASSRSPDAATSDDFVAATANVVIVLAGASVPPGLETGCVHGTSWFVRRLATALVGTFETDKKRTAKDNLAQAIANVNALHMTTCRLMHPRNPSSSVAILQEREQTIDFLLLGNTTILFDGPTDLRVVSGDRVKEAAPVPAAMAPQEIDRPSDSSQGPVIIDQGPHRRHSQSSRSVSTDPNAADHAVTGAIQRRDLRRAAVLSDGITRLVDWFGHMDWPGLLDLLDRNGPEKLIERLRDVERSDPDRQRWPRDKTHENATAVVCHFRPR